MIKSVLNKTPVIWKLIIILILIITVLSVVFIIFHQKTVSLLVSSGVMDKAVISTIWKSMVQYIFIALFLCSLLFSIVYVDITYFIKEINICLKDALTKRKLENNFSDYYSGQTFDNIAANIKSLFSLFQSFDNMKVSRISTETHNLKLLINNISEGVLILNKEKIVTHINHTGETMLKLLPGEIIDQMISRKISNNIILENLDKAVQQDIKITDVELSIKNTILNLNIFPIKNSFGEIIRSLIIIENKNSLSGTKKSS
ncbi:MAG: PAS domain-containing protein [bacterium]|nr:PAS domain-containing protein [bacterium]